MTAPAHKQTDETKQPGQIVNNWYEAVVKHTDTDFEQWWLRYTSVYGSPPANIVARAAWYAALNVK